MAVMKSLVLYRECGGAVVSGSKVVLIAAVFPIQHYREGDRGHE